MPATQPQAANQQSPQIRVQFLDYLFGTQKGYLCLATASNNKVDFRQTFFEWPIQRDIVANFIETHHNSKNIWFCVNLLNRQERKKEYCLPSTFAWADLDYIIPTEGGEVPYPTCVVESSPSRFQAYWRIQGDAIPPDVAEDFSRKIAYKLEADTSGWDLTQLLRIPWTNNFKYDPPVPTKLISISETSYAAELFDKLVVETEDPNDAFNEPMPGLQDLPTLDNVLYKFKTEGRVDEDFSSLFTREPEANADWSRILWRLINKSFEMGMTPEEVLVTANASACNKYKRDNRPISYLWRDVTKAAQEHKRFTLLLGEKAEIVTMPHLADFDEFEEDTFIHDYKEWANHATDAPEQYHELTCFIALSAVICSGLYLSVEWGEIVPNLWGLVLGESTLTRKAQPLDANILTPTGWKKMGDTKIGDEVISQDGKPTKVIGVFPQGEKDIFKVKFGDGSSTECTLDHLWTFKGQGAKSEYKTWPLSEIIGGGLRYGSSSQWIRHIPVVEPVEFDFQPDPPFDPYAMGLLLGDGSFRQTTVRFTNQASDSQLLDSIKEAIKPLGMIAVHASTINPGIDYRLKNETREYRLGEHHGPTNRLKDILEKLNLYGKTSRYKFIPEVYKFGSIETRLAILQGLMDADGWADNSGKSAVICVSSYPLAKDIRDIVWSLGGWSSIKANANAAFNIRVNLPEPFIPFRLNRKLEKLQRVTPRARTMRDVEKVGTKLCQCIKVEHPSGLYVTDDFILTHNTTAMRLAIDTIKDLDESLILATDGSAEGLLTGLSHRPKRVSIFWKDEVSGLFDSINRKDYLAGLPETLTQLYDVPKVLTRLLRKETITISEPYFIFFGGGIRDKVYSLINDEYILSGFLPRFLVVSGENDLSRLRRTQPPTPVSNERKDNIVRTLADLRDRYNTTVESSIGGQKVEWSVRLEARLTDEAWAYYHTIEDTLVRAGYESDMSMLALPTFTRLSFSLLKMSLLVAASRREPDASNRLRVELKDVKQAAFYIERWGHYSIDLLVNAGRSSSEKVISRALTLIRKKEGLPKSELMQRMHLTARDAKDLIDTMIQRGLIDTKPAGRGIRLYSI